MKMSTDRKRVGVGIQGSEAIRCRKEKKIRKQLYYMKTLNENVLKREHRFRDGSVRVCENISVKVTR